jgi:N6-adenosine-specific RNA methylase IME4
MTILISKIKIGKRFRKDLGNTETLSKSITELGLLHPIVLDENNNLIAGRRRIQAFESLGKTSIPYHRVNIKDITMGEFHENSIRKDFTHSEIIAIKEEITKRLTRGRPKKGAKLAPFHGKARDIVSQITGYSHGQIDKIEAIMKSGSKKALAQLEAGTSVNYVHKQIKRQQDKKHTPPIPKGAFDTILADPPWQYEINTRGSPDDHYNVMQTYEIAELKIPAAKDAVLFLWATAPKLENALYVMKNWNFQYVTNMVWVKDRIGTGYYVRGKHELILIGRKGNMPVPDEGDRPPSVIIAPRGRHSEKPAILYSIIEKMYPNGKYLELFARKKHSSKWAAWGNEL